MPPKNYFGFISHYTFIILILSLFPILCSAKGSYPELLKKSVVLPDCCSITSEYTFIHLVRNQECTKCSVSSLYQWNDVIAMIGRKDISYYFIIETRPEDTPETISEALKRRPFTQPMFVDYSNEFLATNRWLKKRKYREINDFVLDKTGAIIKLGDPLNDIRFLSQLKTMK